MKEFSYPGETIQLKFFYMMVNTHMNNSIYFGNVDHKSFFDHHKKIAPTSLKMSSHECNRGRGVRLLNFVSMFQNFIFRYYPKLDVKHVTTSGGGVYSKLAGSFKWALKLTILTNLTQNWVFIRTGHLIRSYTVIPLKELLIYFQKRKVEMLKKSLF